MMRGGGSDSLLFQMAEHKKTLIYSMENVSVNQTFSSGNVNPLSRPRNLTHKH
jgi:hypothetical protein